MPTIDATVGGASANSYITRANATTYFDERLNSGAWTSASDADKDRALIQATRRLDQEDWQGVRVTTGQALDWPRYWATDEDGEEYAADAIPQPIQDATCELALRFLNDGTTDTLADTGLEEFAEAKIGPMEVKRNRSYKAGQLPENVMRLLANVVRSSTSSRRVMRA